MAGGLAALGAGPGDRIATMLPTGNDYLAAWHACIWLGAIEVPVNVEYRGAFLEHILRTRAPRSSSSTRRWLQRLGAISLATSATSSSSASGGGSRDAHRHRHSRLRRRPRRTTPCARHPRDELDLTYIMYTSGTTGRSKGAVHNNRSSIHYLMPFYEGLDLGDDDVCYSMFPLFHQMGRSACTTAALWAGNRVELRSGFSASDFWDDIRACGATWMGYFGAVILFLWQNPPSPGDREHRLTRAFGSSAAPRADHAVGGAVRRHPARGLRLDRDRARLRVSGRATHGSSARWASRAGRSRWRSWTRTTTRCRPARWVRLVWRPKEPFAFFQGYWNLPQATLDASRNLWFHSGDAALIDEDGFFVFKDRIKDTIRRRGENISSFEVELAARAEPGVVECAAYAVYAEGAPTEEEVMIAVVPTPERAARPRGAVPGALRTMPRFAVPRYLRFLDELPKTPTQRVQKFVLRSEGVTADTIDREALGIFPPKE